MFYNITIFPRFLIINAALVSIKIFLRHLKIFFRKYYPQIIVVNNTHTPTPIFIYSPIYLHQHVASGHAESEI